MPEKSMTRVDPGKYEATFSGRKYSVVKEVRRVETGKSSRGLSTTFWTAYREEDKLGDAHTYRDAKKIVLDDVEESKESAPQPSHSIIRENTATRDVPVPEEAEENDPPMMAADHDVPVARSSLSPWTGYEGPEQLSFENEPVIPAQVSVNDPNDPNS